MGQEANKVSSRQLAWRTSGNPGPRLCLVDLGVIRPLIQQNRVFFDEIRPRYLLVLLNRLDGVLNDTETTWTLNLKG